MVVVPRTDGVRGWKNWLGSNVSRGFDPTKGVEQIVKTSDTVALKNLTKVIDLSEPGAKTTLQNLAKKGVSNNKILSKLGKAIRLLNGGLVTADVTNRISKGDYAGALLGATQIIPGPIGWVGLAAQVTYDVSGRDLGGAKIPFTGIPWNRQVRESVEDDINDDRDLGKALIDLGLPDNKEDFAKEIAFYYSLSEGIDPQLLHMLVLAITGEEMSEEQKNWIKDNIPNLTKGLADRITKLRGGKVSGKKQVKESSNCGKKNLLREIVIPEAKKKYKVKPKVLGHPSNKTLSNQMKDTTPNVAFKKEIPVWSMDQKIRNARSSQEKKNEVLEYLGSSGDHWEYMTKTIKEHNKKIIKLNYGGKKKKVTRKEQVDKDTLVFMEDELGNKSSVLQSKINEMQAEAGDKEMFAKYYEMNPQKKSLFKEVVKRGVFDYKGKPSKKGDPDKEPAQLDPNTGMHPEYGKKVKHDKLDPHSAESMPMQGGPEIDANISKNVDQEKKNRKSKILSQPNG